MFLDEEQIIKSLVDTKSALERYIKIMEMFRKVDVSTNYKFQASFIGFYNIQHSKFKEFCSGYFSFMEKHKNSVPSFIDTLRYLYKFGRLEISFSSKLLATIDPGQPVWDRYILKFFNLKKPPRKRVYGSEMRIAHGNDAYEKLKQKYKAFIATDESKRWIQLFDMYFPICDITPIKKIDFIICKNWI